MVSRAAPMNLGRAAKAVRARRSTTRAFTLIELILVMTLLVIVIGISIPSLQNFFRGRNLDSEGRRFLSLVRYGQSRAISEGIPMMLWIDSRQRSYGLEAQPGYSGDDTNKVTFALDRDIEIEAELPRSTLFTRSNTWTQLPRTVSKIPVIRLLPDGFIAETSPYRIILRQRKTDELWITADENARNYEIAATHATGERRR